MKLSIKAGSTSQSFNIFLADSSSTTGGGLTGLVFNTSSLVCYYTFTGTNTTAVAVTLATLAAVNSAYSSGGFKEISSANMPGWYRFDPPDAALAAASGRAVNFHFKGAANLAPLPLEIELTGWDNQDAVRAGLTALPNAAAEAAGGLYTRGTGAGQIKQTNNGEIDANATRLAGTANTGRDIGASVLLSAGSGTGQLDFTSGVVKSNLAQILGTALTETAGQIAAAFKKFFNIATPAATMDHGILVDTVTTATTATTLTNAPSDSSGTTTLLSRLSAARAGYLDNLSAGAVALASDMATLLSRITSTLFSGITQLSHWLGAIAGKQAANSTAQTEIRASGAGSGTFDPTTDSGEAIRDRGDAAWMTGSGTSTLTQGDIRTAVGLASANLDTQLDALPTNTELTAALNTLLTTAMTESYSADGATMTPAQALYELRALASEFSISGTTMTVKKKDGSTTAFTLTLDSATAPTSITRAT